MRKAHQLIAIAAVSMFGAGLAGTALAQDTAPAASGDAFTALDTDKDGMISTEEAGSNADLAARWKELDANEDDKLDQAEFAQFEVSPAPSSEDPTTKP